jgi:hypothetical protein
MLVFDATDTVVRQFAIYELFNPRLGSTSVKGVGLFSLRLELEGVWVGWLVQRLVSLVTSRCGQAFLVRVPVFFAAGCWLKSEFFRSWGFFCWSRWRLFLARSE